MKNNFARVISVLMIATALLGFAAAHSMHALAQFEDVAVTEVTTSRTWVYYGFSAEINVTVMNMGELEENVTVTAYYDINASKIIGTQVVPLSPNQSQIVTFTWIATGVAYPQNYTISANASIPADGNPANDILNDGIIEVRILGDINGDGSVNVLDAILFGNQFGLQQGDPGWNGDADLNGDGKVNILDLIIVGQCFGNTGSP